MNLFTEFLRGNARELNILLLAVILAISHLTVLVWINRKRRLVEPLTYRSVTNSTIAAGTFLGIALVVSYCQPEVAKMAGFAVSLLLASVVSIVHSIVILSGTGFERSARFVTGMGGVVVAIMLLPSLFSPDLPYSVALMVKVINIAAPLFLLVSSVLALLVIAKGAGADISSFRAARSLRVLLLASCVTAVVLICSPFILAATPAEGIAVLWCSAVTCASGAHAVTERTDYLLAYLRSNVPEVHSLNALQVVQLAEKSIGEATKLLAPPRALSDALFDENERALSNPQIVPRDLIRAILHTKEVEERLIGRLLNVHSGLGKPFKREDAVELVTPFQNLSAAHLGVVVPGISERLMETISRVRESAHEAIPVILVGESGVGKRRFAEAIANLREMSVSDTNHSHSLDGRDFERARSLHVVSTNSFDEFREVFEGLATNVKVHAGRNLVVTTEQPEVAKNVSRFLAERNLSPEIVAIPPLRSRLQDLFCQVIVNYFSEAEKRYGGEFANTIELPVPAVLSSVTSKWRGNEREVLEAVRLALSLTKADCSAIQTFLLFDESDGVERVSPWFATRLSSEIATERDTTEVEHQLVNSLGVEKSIAGRIAAALALPAGEMHGASHYA